MVSNFFENIAGIFLTHVILLLLEVLIPIITLLLDLIALILMTLTGKNVYSIVVTIFSPIISYIITLTMAALFHSDGTIPWAMMIMGTGLITIPVWNDLKKDNILPKVYILLPILTALSMLCFMIFMMQASWV